MDRKRALWQCRREPIIVLTELHVPGVLGNTLEAIARNSYYHEGWGETLRSRYFMTESDVRQVESSSSLNTTFLERVRQHDQASWERLVALCAPLIYSWCRQAGFQDADAEDFGQQVFTSVYKHINDFRRDNANDTFHGWLREITKNKIRDRIRRERRRPKTEASGGSGVHSRLQQLPAIDSPLEESRSLNLQAVRLLSKYFSDRDIRAFEEVVIHGRTPADVASDFGVKPNVIYLAISRIRKRLRLEFEGLGIG